jgi:acyl-CoA thioester hydrolase
MPFCCEVRVYWEDTDAGGIVYYANYLRFLERARTEWLRSLGWDQGTLANEYGVLFVVRSAALDFLRPARLDDVLRVEVAVAATGAATIEFEQRIERCSEVLVTARVKIACVRIAAFQPARIPRKVRDALERQ